MGGKKRAVSFAFVGLAGGAFILAALGVPGDCGGVEEPSAWEEAEEGVSLSAGLSGAPPTPTKPTGCLECPDSCVPTNEAPFFYRCANLEVPRECKECQYGCLDFLDHEPYYGCLPRPLNPGPDFPAYPREKCTVCDENERCNSVSIPGSDVDYICVPPPTGCLECPDSCIPLNEAPFFLSLCKRRSPARMQGMPIWLSRLPRPRALLRVPPATAQPSAGRWSLSPRRMRGL